MNLEELRAFLAVVETGSFLTAAKVMRLPRATLRRRVDELEARVGAPLLNRLRAGATPTDTGRVLAARGRFIIQEASALLQSVREVGAEPSGILRVMLPVGLPPHVLQALVALVRGRYPLLNLHVRMSENPVGGLLDDVDLALHFGERSPEGPWISHEILRVRVWLLASADYLARRGAPRCIDELHEHTLLSWEAQGEDGRSWPTSEGGTFTVAPVLRTGDIHLLRQCAGSGMGIALLPDALLPEPGPSALVPVLPEQVGRDLAVRVVVPRALGEIPKIRAILDLIRPFVAGMGGGPGG